ncbi:MFS transporter [Rhodopseudomonas sp. NSM]|uniref:MFS transporter n=1 Tax=Rhodopseudomonas sp. NSM TaxID=3457630 RepID=UPI0040353E96
MTDLAIDDANAASGTRINRAGVYIALLQLLFALCWTIYVVFLPKLAAEVGIAPGAVILILMLDQAIFTIADTAMGIAADKVGSLAGRIGLFVGIATAVSCAAFVALPFVTSGGPSAQLAFIALIVVWAATSSALRAPPLTLFGKYGARPSLPWLSALTMLGYGLAGAVSPYLGVVMKDIDARLPFVISSVVLLITTLALSRVERGLSTAQPVAKPRNAGKAPGRLPALFIAAMVLLALGYQMHFGLNSAPLFLRFAKPDDLQWLMPVFWIGFNIALFPASVVVKHRGGVIVMGVAGLLGALAVAGAEYAGHLNVLIAAQFLAGAAWGCMLMSAVSAALAIGQTGAEGRLTGLVFSALALATFARMAAAAGGLQKLPDYTPLLYWAPVACWSVAGTGLLVLAASRLRTGVSQAP